MRVASIPSSVKTTSFCRHLVALLATGFLPQAGAQQFRRVYDLVPDLGASPYTVDAQVLGRTSDLPGQPPTAWLGNKSCIADLNGDGADDLVLSASTNADGGFAAGRVHIWFGGAGFGGLMDLETSPADVTILAASPEDALGAEYNAGKDRLATGDVNGDGITDLILGATNADGPADGRPNCGEAYVIFGRAVFPALLDLAVQGPGGADVTIQGAVTHDHLTRGTIETADLNGDGIDDLILPAMRLSLDRRVHVLFGRAVFPAVMDLAVPANSSVTIYGGLVSGAPNGLVGDSGAITTGDVNGDGTADLILADPRAGGPAESRPESGEAYIIFGREAPAMFPATLDVQVQGSSGADVTIYGASSFDNLAAGYFLDPVLFGEMAEPLLATGDLNGDGIADLVLGTYSGDGPGEARTSCGELYVVLGRPAFPTTLDLAMPGSSGADVTIHGGAEYDALGGPGMLVLADVNGDGTRDLVTGSSRADGGVPFSYRGEAYVVFGRNSPEVFPATLDFGIQGSGGADVTIHGANLSGEAESFMTNRSLGAGDLNGDGADELFFSAPYRWSFFYSANPRFQSGETYIVRGRPSPQTFPAVMSAASADITLYGGPGDRLGEAGAFSVGDLNDDGLGDLVMTNPAADGPLDNRPQSGEAYVLFGRTGVSAADREIEVEQPVGTGLTDGSATVDFGAVNPGVSGVPITFTIKNSGGLLLNVTSIGTSGGESGEFAVTAPALPDVIWPGQEITCEVTFTPGAGGPRGTVLQIATDDADEATFDIALAGTGNSPPALQLPASPLVVTATSPAGAVVNFTVTATDAEDTPDPMPVATPPSGSLFPVGETSVSVEVTDSGGLITTDSFTVRVDPAGTHAAAWRQLHFGSPDNSGDAADDFDADHDGIVNVMERFLGLDPNQPAPLPVALERQGGVLEFTYPRTVLALSENTFEVQWSDDLTAGSWSTAGVTEQILSDDGITQQILTFVPEGTGRRFVRLAVTANP